MIISHLSSAEIANSRSFVILTSYLQANSFKGKNNILRQKCLLFELHFEWYNDISSHDYFPCRK